MAGDTTLKSSMGSLWVQPRGPNKDLIFLGCHDLGDISEGLGGRELQRCFLPDGSGWRTIGNTRAAPDVVTTSIETPLTGVRDWLERLGCNFTLYAMIRSCNRVDEWAGNDFDMGEILINSALTQKTKSGYRSRQEEATPMLSVDIEADPPVLSIDKLVIDRLTTASAVDLLDIAFNTDRLCGGDCGDRDPGEDGVVATEAATSVATADVLLTGDFGATWAAAAADPFAAGGDVASIVKFNKGSGVRILVALESPTGGQGQVSYSDDNGATWTDVNIGGGAAGHGAVHSEGLFALDGTHIWLAGAAGYIYFSSDYGETWTAQESGSIHAGNYYSINFANKTYGVAGGAAGVIAITRDGGSTWTAGTVTGAGDVYTVARLNSTDLWAGDDDGKLWYSEDGATTWTQRTGWTGSGTGAIRASHWVNEHVGFMAHNTSAPVGTLYRTITGGRYWDEIATPANTGINAVFAVNENLAYAAGNAQGGTGVILKAYSVAPGA